MPTPMREGTRISRIQSKGQRVRQEMSGLSAEIEGALSDFERIVREQLERRPYATLAAASGVGYVLGGGVPVALSRMVFGVGARLAVLVLAERVRDGVVSTVSGEQSSERE